VTLPHDVDVTTHCYDNLYFTGNTKTGSIEKET